MLLALIDFDIIGKSTLKASSKRGHYFLRGIKEDRYG
jgi:hypothetical protein